MGQTLFRCEAACFGILQCVADYIPAAVPVGLWDAPYAFQEQRQIHQAITGNIAEGSFGGDASGNRRLRVKRCWPKTTLLSDSQRREFEVECCSFWVDGDCNLIDGSDDPICFVKLTWAMR